MTTVTRMWWIRHAPVTTDGGRIYGASDVPADFSHRPTFEGLARALPPGAVWVTSHLSRARDTALAVRAAGGDVTDPLLEDRALGEQSFGEWQGRPRDEVYREQAEWHRFWLAPATTRPPGGESFVDVMGRVASAIDRLVGAHAGRDLCIVAHGGPIRAAIARALDLSPEKSIAFVVDNCSITRIDHIARADDEAVWRVVAVNRPPV